MYSLNHKFSLVLLGLAAITVVGLAFSQPKENDQLVSPLAAPSTQALNFIEINFTVDNDPYLGGEWKYVYAYSATVSGGGTSTTLNAFPGNEATWVSDTAPNIKNYKIRFEFYTGMTILVNTNNTEWGKFTAISPLTEPGIYSLNLYTDNFGYASLSRTGNYTGYYAQELSPGITVSKERLWVDRGNNYSTTNAFCLLSIGTDLYKPSGYYQVLVTGNNFAFYDITSTSVEGQTICFLKVKNDMTTIWNTSATRDFVEGDNSYLFVIGDGETNTLTRTVISSQVKNDGFAKILEGYLTCLNDLSNGYAAFNKIDTNFLPRESGFWDMEGNLDLIDIIDYAYASGYDYATSRGTGLAVDAFDKYKAMETSYNALPLGTSTPVLVAEGFQSIAFVVSFAVTAILIAGSYFLIGKKNSAI